jgi:hypothetical protein
MPERLYSPRSLAVVPLRVPFTQTFAHGNETPSMPVIAPLKSNLRLYFLGFNGSWRICSWWFGWCFWIFEKPSITGYNTV